MKSKGHLVNTNICCYTPVIGVCHSQKPKHFPKTWNWVWLPGLLVKFIHCILLFDNDPLNTFFETWAKSLGLLKNYFPSKKIWWYKYFPGGTKPHKWPSVFGWFFFVVVRSQQKEMYECNLESSLLSNFFNGKEFIVPIFWEWQKNLPTCNLSGVPWHMSHVTFPPSSPTFHSRLVHQDTTKNLNKKVFKGPLVHKILIFVHSLCYGHMLARPWLILFDHQLLVYHVCTLQSAMHL